MTRGASNAELIRAAYRHWEESLGSDSEPFFARAAGLLPQLAAAAG